MFDGLHKSKNPAKMVRLFSKKDSDQDDDIYLEKIKGLPEVKGGRINKYRNLYDTIKEV